MGTKRYSQLPHLSPQRNGEEPQSLPAVYTAQPEEGDEGGLDLGQLFAAVWRRKFIVASVTIAVASAAVALGLKSTPTYEAKFELLTEPVTTEKNPLEKDDDKKEDEPEQALDETELKVLQSPRLLSPITKKIQVKYPGSDIPKLNISILPNTKILEVGYQDPNPEKIRYVLDVVADTYLKYSLEERQKDIRQGIKFVEDQLPQLQQRVEVLQARLQNFRQRHDLISPQGQGQQLANQRGQIAQQRLENQAQLARTRAIYNNLQNQLRLQPDEAVAASAVSESPRYQKLLNQLQELETKIAAKAAQYQEDSPTIQLLRIQQQKLLPLMEQEGRRILGNKHSSTIVDSLGLASPNSLRISQIKQFLDAAKQIQVLEAQNEIITEAESSLRRQVKEFPILVRQNDDLERQLKIAGNNLNQFLTEREALAIDAAQKQVPWQILTPPTEPQSSSGSVKLNLILGSVLGFLLGIGAALVVDKFKNVFYTRKEVKDTTGLPVLGEIPYFKLRKDGQPALKHGASDFEESLRSLYTNIHFLSFTNVDAPIRSLAIISAAHGDGKSTMVLHLAQTAAAMGRRVLLVDADLRSPTMHTVLGLSNTKGLSDIIAEELDFHQVIQRSPSIPMQAQNSGSRKAAPKKIEEFPLEDNLFVLTAGQVPPNPTSLLSSEKMQSLAEQFQQAFDLVIYDTSPLLGFADSSLLAVHTDASILVVGLGKTNRSALAEALEQLKFSCTPILGVVANGIKGQTTRSHVLARHRQYAKA